MSFLGRYRFVLLAVVGIGLAVGVFFVLKDSATPSANQPAGSLGPTPGPNSDGYVAAKKAYLARIAGDDPGRRSAALISFSSLKKAADVKAALGVVNVSAVFTKFPSAEIEALQVTGTVETAMADKAAVLKQGLSAELPQLQRRLQSASGTARADIAKLIADHRQAMSSVTPGCACIFAVAVNGASVDALSKLQARGDVRLVDVPDPISPTLAGWNLRPLVPR